MKIALSLAATVPMPLSVMEQSPALVIEKMPRIHTLTQVSDTSYRFETVAFKYRGLPSFIGTGCLEIRHATSHGVAIVNGCDYILPADNCSIEAHVSGDDYHTFITGIVEIDHPLLNIVTRRLVAPLFKRIQKEMTDEFIANFNNPAFRNVVERVD